MATESDMIAMRAELTNLTTTVKTMENRLQNQLDPKIVQYDEMLTAFETLSGSWKEKGTDAYVGGGRKTKGCQRQVR